jgi:hypothetical protein
MKQQMSKSDSQTAWNVVIALVVWLGVAIGIGMSGVLHGASAGLLSGMIWILTIAVMVIYGCSRPLRTWTRTIDMRVLILFHSLRFVGAAFFLLNAAEGRLPQSFSMAGERSGLVVAALALVVAATAVPVRSARQWWIVLGWNLIGLASVLRVLVAGMELGIADMHQMAPMTEWPLNLLPTFLVPVVISTHLVIFSRLWRSARRAPTVIATI